MRVRKKPPSGAKGGKPEKERGKVVPYDALAEKSEKSSSSYRGLGLWRMIDTQPNRALGDHTVLGSWFALVDDITSRWQDMNPALARERISRLIRVASASMTSPPGMFDVNISHSFQAKGFQGWQWAELRKERIERMREILGKLPKEKSPVSGGRLVLYEKKD